MNKYLKSFLHRGLIFGGFGPIICGIVFLILSFTLDDFSLSGYQVFIATVSTYLLAFVHAGASIFNQIEEWSITKSLFFHFATLYIAYSVCYLANAWIPFDPKVLIIFTAMFVALYFLIWVIVYSCVKSASKKFNEKLK